MNMKKVTVPLSEFIDSYKESLGVEGAEQLMKQAVYSAGLIWQIEFTKEEALKICYELKKYPGFIGIIGGILNSRLILR